MCVTPAEGSKTMSDGEKKVLLVDDEPAILDVYSNRLGTEGFSVQTASDGEAAKILLADGSFRLVISDMRMPNCSGVQLLTWIRTQKLDLDVIFITGFSSVEDTRAAYDLGCKGFLAKPIDFVELVRLARQALGQDSGPAEAFDESRFGRVPLEDFLSGKKIMYSIYVRMKDGRFLKVAHTGEDMDQGRLLALQNKGINELWLSADDFAKYCAISLKMSEIIRQSSSIAPERRAKLVRQISSAAAENIRLAGVSPENVEVASRLFEENISTFSTGEGAVGLLESIVSQEQSRYAHASLCGIFCALIAKVMAWNSPKNVMSLTLGGFLHDIGLLGLPPEMQTIEPHLVTSGKEFDQYRQHPDLGAKMLAGLKTISSEVIACVAHHHEDVRGTGYPNARSRGEIFPMSRIVFLVDHFVDEMFRHPPQERVRAAEILDSLLDANRGAFDIGAAMALRAVISEPTFERAQRKYAAYSKK